MLLRKKVYIVLESNKIYKPGNWELLTMIAGKSFDTKRASELIRDIPDIDQPIIDLDGYSTTYLFRAQESNNLEAVRFLLTHGADPNFNDPDLFDNCALWDLCFPAEDEKDAPVRYEIAKLFFEYGADPDMLLEGESLYDHVLYEVYNEMGSSSWLYTCDFYKLLIAWNDGKKHKMYPKPVLTKQIDKCRIDEYEIRLFLCDDGYHIEGHMFDPEGNDIGVL